MTRWPQFVPQQLKQTKASEYLLRFALGGAISVGAWAIGTVYGPRVGGLFLAFPAILPASLTLVKEHDGRHAAADDARGAVLGSVGLVGFGLTVMALALADRSAPVALLCALVVWSVVSLCAWTLWFGPPRELGKGHARCTPNASAGSHDKHQSQ